MPVLGALASLWKSRRSRIIIYAILTGLVCGAANLLLPAEDLLIDGRAAIRRHAAPQDITVVAIDDKTLRSLGTADVSRTNDAKVINQLFEIGARRVFFDRTYQFANDEVGDETLISVLKAHTGKIYFGAAPSNTDTFADPLSSLPDPRFRKHVDLVGLSALGHPFGLMVSYPLTSMTPEGRVPSMAAELAGVTQWRDGLLGQSYPSSLPEGYFRPDYSMDFKTVPTVSYIDFLEGRADPRMIAGRDIVVAGTAKVYRDEYEMLFRGYVSGVFFHVIAAHTLKQGPPIRLGWIPVLILVSIVLISGIGRGRSLDRYRIVGLISVLFAGPLLLDHFSIEVEVLPAVFAAGVAIFRARALDRVEAASEINVASGLPSLQSLRTSASKLPGSLIALKLRNYSAITGSFAKPVETEFAAEIVRRIRIGDPGAVVFHEGDKFLWSSSLTNPVDLIEHLEGLHRIVQNGLVIEGREIDVSFNCGVETDGEKEVAKRVSNALQLAEQAVRDDELVCLHNPKGDELQWEISLLSSLDHAIDDGEVWVAYQPKLDLHNDHIKGAEALVRWTHPERGPINPEQFIGIAEEYHRIERITQFVLNEAVRAASEIIKFEPDFTISVNISAQLLRNPGLPKMVADTLLAYDLPSEKLILEITETDRLDRSSKTFEMMQRLVESGLQLSIDDFGTGNATIDYLRYLPASEVKIDKVFVSGMESNKEDKLLVQSIIEMAHSLDRRVVAEGVENKRIMESLRNLGCDQVQGYHISRAVRLEEFLEMLRPAMVKKYS